MVGSPYPDIPTGKIGDLSAPGEQPGEVSRETGRKGPWPQCCFRPKGSWMFSMDVSSVLFDFLAAPTACRNSQAKGQT